MIDIQQGLNTQQILLSVLFILTLFVCVVLHELGHSIAAQKYGAEVHSITLLPIGGMANIRNMPEKPVQEIVVTAAGLVVNIIIALIIWAIISTVGELNLQQMDFTKITTKNFFVMLMFVNLFVVAFNLIPAFPMDGGRLLRAALSVRMSKLKATQLAKNIGQVLAVGFVFVGLFINPFLVIIGIFIFIGAGAEYKITRLGQYFRAYKAKDALITEFITLSPENNLGNAAEKLLHHQANGFVVAESGKLKGIITKDDIINNLNKKGHETPVSNIMSAGLEPVSPQTSLQKVFKMIQERKYSIVPVVENDQIKGMLDLDHLNKFVLVKSAINKK